MFMSSWLYALIAMAIAMVIYKYIEYRGYYIIFYSVKEILILSFI